MTPFLLFLCKIIVVALILLQVKICIEVVNYNVTTSHYVR